MAIEELKQKADELKIEYDEDISEDDLSKLIDDQEKKSIDPDFLNEERKKAYKARDKEKTARRKAEEKLKTLNKKIEDMTANSVDKDEYESLKQQLEELSEKQREREEAEEAKLLEKADEVQKAKILHDKEMARIRKEFDEKLKLFESKESQVEQEKNALLKRNEALRKKTLEGEILIASTKANALRPTQIVRLLKEDFEWDDDLGKFIVEEKDAKGKIIDYHDVESYVTSFLEKEENDNLVKSNLPANSQRHTPGETRLQKVKPQVKSDKYDPKDPHIIAEADREGLSVEQVIRNKEIRDKRFAERNK